MRYSISHRTTYEYREPVSVSHHVLRLKPRDRACQRTHKYNLNSEPAPAVLESHSDYFGNTVSFLTVEGAHRQLTVTSQCEVDVESTAPVQPAVTPGWEIVRDQCHSDTYTTSCGEACEYCFPSGLILLRPDYRDYAGSSFATGRPVLEAAVDLMGRIHSDFVFDNQSTTVATPLEKVFRQRRGVCQDFAHLQIACLRAMGLPARYVSGYLETVPPPGQPKLVGADASHAWVQLWCGEIGWVDLDPTNNLLPHDKHITLAFGRDFADVSPLRGVLLGSGTHQLKVAVDVNRLHEPPTS